MNAPVILNQEFLSNLFNRSEFKVNTVERTVFLELEESVRRLVYLRQQFASKARHVQSQLDEACRLAATPGREPNRCGALQAAAELESLNGQISAGSETVRSMVNVAKAVGILEKTNYVC